MDVVKSFLKSRKFWMFIITPASAWIAQYFGASPEIVGGVLLAGVAKILGIAIEDHGTNIANGAAAAAASRN